MEDNKSKFKKGLELVNLWASTIESILGIGGILGGCAVVISGDIISDNPNPHILTIIFKPIIFFAIDYKEVIIPIIFCFLLFELIIYFLYIYCVKKYDIPSEEAKKVRPPFIITVAILITEIFLVFKFSGQRDDNTVVTASSSEREYNGKDIPIVCEESSPSKDFFTEKQLVEYYIKRCFEENIPIEELEELTTDQLYYIRNGIYAYCGKYYKSGYYDEFDWYDGHIVTEDDEVFWKLFNSFQKDNIESIKSIENKRRKLKAS